MKALSVAQTYGRLLARDDAMRRGTLKQTTLKGSKK